MDLATVSASLFSISLTSASFVDLNQPFASQVVLVETDQSMELFLPAGVRL